MALEKGQDLPLISELLTQFEDIPQEPKGMPLQEIYLITGYLSSQIQGQSTLGLIDTV